MKIAPSFSRGHLAYAHDMRLTHKNNIDQTLSNDNVILRDKLQGRNLNDYLNEIMQPYIDEYNAKQTRKSRRINQSYTDYWKSLEDNEGKSMCYEFVMQYGAHEDIGKEFYEGQEKEALKEEMYTFYQNQLEAFEKAHPHYQVLWAVIHMDEPNGTPHMHMGLVPIGEGYKQGLSHQISESRALANDGIERAQKRSEGYQRERLYEQVKDTMKIELLSLGYEIKPPTEEHKPHLTTEKFIEQKEIEKSEDKQIIYNAVEHICEKKFDLNKALFEEEKKGILQKPTGNYIVPKETIEKLQVAATIGEKFDEEKYKLKFATHDLKNKQQQINESIKYQENLRKENQKYKSYEALGKEYISVNKNNEIVLGLNIAYDIVGQKQPTIMDYEKIKSPEEFEFERASSKDQNTLISSWKLNEEKPRFMDEETYTFMRLSNSLKKIREKIIEAIKLRLAKAIARQYGYIEDIEIKAQQMSLEKRAEFELSQEKEEVRHHIHMR